MDNIIIFIVSTLIYTNSAQLHAPDFATVCLYNNKAALRPFSAKLNVTDVDVTLCSHLVYMAITFDLKSHEFIGTIPLIDNSPNGFAAAIALRHQTPLLKVYVMLTIDRILVTSIQENTQNFTNKMQQFLSAHEFDGLCLNFNVERFDWHNLNVFKSLQMALKQRNLGLIAIVPFKMNVNEEQQHDWIEFLNANEYVGVSTFNMHRWSQSNNYVNSHTALYGQNCTNMACAIDSWLNIGLRLDKLIVGIATHGVSFTLANTSNVEPLAPAVDHGAAGAYLKSRGIRTHYEICSSLHSEAWISHYDETAMVPFVTSGRQWVGYDDVNSVTHKIDFVKEKAIAGVFIWTMDMDDFNGLCGTRWPITTAAVRRLSQPWLRSSSSTAASSNEYNCFDEGLFPHPFDCAKFIQCSRALVSYRMDCPYGLHFNYQDQICDWPDLAECAVGHEVTTEMPPPTFSCRDKTGLYENPQNCSTFYWCNNGLLIGQSQCPEGLLFNGQFKICDWPFNVRCNVGI